MRITARRATRSPRSSACWPYSSRTRAPIGASFSAQSALRPSATRTSKGRSTMTCRRSPATETMTLPPSGSETSTSFDLLHDRVRRWIWDQRWSELRDVQETAIRELLGGERDVIITAATAAGKTEAAFLPICSTLTGSDAETGVKVLYVGPLKALINDQWQRLDGLCESLEIPVHRWHGDVNAAARQKLVRQPDGI